MTALLLLAACDQAPQQTASSAQPADRTPAETSSQPAAEAQAGAPAADTAPLFGTWAANLAWCDGNGEGFPITISATRFEGRENVCDITSLEDNGDGSFTAALSCTGEGQTNTERVAMTPIFGPSGEGLRLDYLDRSGEPTTVFRC